MSPSPVTLIGRQRELAALASALDAARAGKGGLLLIAGEAGAGKTRLVEAALADQTLSTLFGRAMLQTTPPYGPIVAALRDYSRRVPNALAGEGPLAHYLPLILPELGPAPNGSDPAALVEAVCDAFESIARRQPSVVFLDDLQWADNATFGLLPRLAESLARQPMLVIGTYRNDEIPRGHPLRQLRTELRRQRQLREIVVEPLDPRATAELAAGAFGSALSPALSAALYERTQGIPLFIEELAHALSANAHLHTGPAGLELASGQDMPMPETLRDAVLLRMDALSAQARKLLEIAAVLGLEFNLALAAELAQGDAALDELFERNWISEAGTGSAVFRHALTREAVYNQIPWTRRRAWHRDVATRLEAQGAAPEVLAEHWLAAHEPDPARRALLAMARQSCSVHAYRDAAGALQRALELWPKGAEEPERLEMLDQLGYCAQLSGQLSDAIRAWREVIEYRQTGHDTGALAQAQRRLATAYELQGAWEQVLAVRQAAAQAFAESGHAEEAATERLSAAAHLRSAGRFRPALELLTVARAEVAGGQRWDLQARILGLEGNVRARMGEFDAGVAMVRAGLALALEHELSAPTAEVYQRLADALEHAGDYAGAKDTYQTAFDFCRTNAAPTVGQVCMACLTAVLFHIGEWDRAGTVCRDVLASPDSPLHALTVGNCILGLVYVLRGQAGRARPLLLEAHTLGNRIELAACEILSTWGLALLDEYDHAPESAAEHCRALLQHWQQIQELHYAIAPLRWATTRFSALQASSETRACANALATIASITGQPEALSALAHALGEVAMLDCDYAQAVQQFSQSLQLLQQIESPYEAAETHLRLGIALLTSGQREPAVEHLVQACRTAEKLGAKPLAERAARELAALGEPIDRRIGRRAASKLQQAGLTRRQLEILQLVAQGRTNQEIASALSVSPRTVEMHVGDILSRLDSHTRTEAVRKAGELGLLKIP